MSGETCPRGNLPRTATTTLQHRPASLLYIFIGSHLIGTLVEKVLGNEKQNSFREILDEAEVIAENLGFKLSVPRVEGKS